MTRRSIVRMATGFVALAAATVVVTQLTARTEASHAPDPGVTPGTAAMRAYLNPETGKLDVGAGPTVAADNVDATTENALRRDATGLVEVHHPDGSVSVNLQGRFQSVAVLKKTKNGDVFVCTDMASPVPQEQAPLEVK
jgi:acylphosphatase